MAPLARKQSLQAQAYQAVRSAILSGEISAGTRLIETQLAKQLQVSRTPIREAIRQLQQENLITIDAAGTLRVATLSMQDAVQLYTCRIALEQLSVTGACETATEREINALQDLVVAAEQTDQLQFTNAHLLNLDYQFHRSIARSSGNLWLTSLLDQVFDQMALLRIQTLQHNPQVLEIRQEHREIYRAIADRDADQAVEMIVSHLSASRDRVICEIERLQQDGL
ncbi:MAG TPA: GntR family transcriptional regulator [Leptolyngbya sp.]|nr:GntR family transcriptional regulator [Leptolyngbya sp.]